MQRNPSEEIPVARLRGEPPPAKDISLTPPEREVTMPDGRVRTEKLNPMRCKAKMVDRDGNVVWVSLATGWSIEKIGPANPYGMVMWQDKLKAGWIPYNKCPVAEGYIKGEKGDKPCEDKFSNDQCCPHVEAIIKARREDHRRKADRFNRKSETQMDRLIKSLSDAVDNNAEVKASKRFVK